MSTQDNDNMALWNQVCTTPPDITKHVNQRGGFTAVCAQAQLKRATELWGPYGKAWGMKNCIFEYIRDGKGDILVLDFTGTFFCPIAELTTVNDMPFKVGDDCKKKVMTGARSKALSWLGFNSDVFEGLYDDNQYVQQLKQQASGGSKPAQSQGNPKTNPAPKEEQVNKDKWVTACKNLANQLIKDKDIKPVDLVNEIISTDPSIGYFKTTKIESMDINQLKKLHDALKIASEIPF